MQSPVEHSFYTHWHNDLISHLSQKLGFPPNIVREAINKLVAGEGPVDDYSFDFINPNQNLSIEDRYQESLYSFQQAISEYVLNVDGLSFPISESSGNELGFLSAFKQVVFTDCKFTAAQNGVELDIDFSILQFKFVSCSFETNIRLSGLEHADITGSIFEYCQFFKTVFIDSGHVDTADQADEEVATVIRFGSIFNNLAYIQTLVITGLFSNLPLIDDAGESLNASEVIFDGFKLLQSCRLLLNVESLYFKDVICSKALDLSYSIIHKLTFDQAVFKQAVSFQNCQLGQAGSPSAINFNYIEFSGFVNFRNAMFSAPLNLINNQFHYQPNFLEASFSKQAELGTDRETFRIIKHSFNSVGNNVEANRFFAYEMEAYRRELKKGFSKANCWELALVTINRCISNHGQSYVRASLWLLTMVVIAGLVLMNHEAQWLPTNFAGPKWWQCFRDLANGLARGFLPFTPIYQAYKGFEAFILFMGLALSGITWQLLVALRRHSKK